MAAYLGFKWRCYPLHKDNRYTGRLRKAPSQGVLSAAITDDQNLRHRGASFTPIVARDDGKKSISLSATMTDIKHYYSSPGLAEAATVCTVAKLKAASVEGVEVVAVTNEFCYNVQVLVRCARSRWI